MEQINYVNEHLFSGQLGQFLIILGFVAALFSAVSYFFSTQNQIKELPNEGSWKRLGRIGFGLHGLSIFGIVGIMFFIMISKYYEYWYVFGHVSNTLSDRYIFAAFWGGQEGSFLIWMFWHVVLGFVLMWKAKKWEAPTLAVVALVEAFLTSMLLGLYFSPEDVKIGSNPFVLARDMQDIPLFNNPDYLKLLTDGQGLNPLLQNYWMTIHPPTLFLGFASTVVPFAFAIAGLWTKQHKSWLKPMMPWALFSATILGLGILMGGVWAYEALSFGGYWAWDPVENMSLVPWLILIAGIHTGLIARATGYSIKSTYLFTLLTFIFIVYSTFLTRSGILGDTSVHAFTEMGLEWQLVIFLGTFLILSLALLISRRKSIPAPPREESAYSREFWMFIGSLVLIFSSILITFTTSIPVYNTVAQFFNPNALAVSPPSDVVEHYNKYQLWIAVLVGVLSAIAQFMRYKDQKGLKSAYMRKAGIHLGLAALVAAVFTLISTYFININAWQYMILMWALLFSTFANGDYIISVLKGKIKVAASPVAHIGFAVMLIGTMASGLNKDVISAKTLMNVNLIEGFDKKDAGENVLLRKNLPTRMGDYLVTYQSDTTVKLTRHFTINYQRLNDENKVVENFTLHPNILYDRNFSKIEASNPSTKHYVHRDIFTHISALPKAEMEPKFAKELEDSLKYQSYEISIGDTIYTSNYYVIYDGVDYKPYSSFYKPQPEDKAKGARLIIKKIGTDSTWKALPIVVERGGMEYEVADKVPELRFKVKYNQQQFENRQFEFKEGETQKIGRYDVTFIGFDKNFDKEKLGIDSEIAIGASMRIENKEKGVDKTLTPIFYILNNQQFNVPDEDQSLGMKIRFLQPNPTTGNILVQIEDSEKIFVDIAENAMHDYVVMQAIVFPGINLFWLGSLMMLFGLGMGFWDKYKQSFK